MQFASLELCFSELSFSRGNLLLYYTETIFIFWEGGGGGVNKFIF